MKPTDDEQVGADLRRLLIHVDHCVSQFEQAAVAFSKVQTLDGSAWIMLRELGRAGGDGLRLRSDWNVKASPGSASASAWSERKK
jgi:hypothetical protein